MALQTASRRALVPARGLLHPAWLACLGLLALNDHALKGAGILPGVVTGKLSDFVGLFVAPLLLALVLRVRTDRGFRLAHVAVGVVFGAIQLSAFAADTWSALMGLVGFPWGITRDPTDLVALPALVASLVVLRRALALPTARVARRGAETVAAGVGLLACVATSAPDGDPIDEPEPLPEGGTDGDPDDAWLPELWTDVYLHNATSRDVVVRIRTLAPEVDLACEAIAAAPGALVTSPLLGLAQTWTLPPGTNQPVVPVDDGRDCHAALVESDGLPPKIVFWHEGDPVRHTVPGMGRVIEDAGEVAILAEPDGGAIWAGGVRHLHDAVPVAATCEPQLDAQRVAFSEPVPWGRARLEELSQGPDGCFALELLRESAGADTWFLCVPAETMVLQPGDELELALPEGAPGLPGSFDAIAIDVLADTEGVPMPGRRMTVSVGGGAPRIAGLSLAFVPDPECAPEVQPACGTVARPGHVAIEQAGAEPLALAPDAVPLVLEDLERQRQLHLALVHAQERTALHAACALGPDTLGTDLELVVAERPLN